MLQWKTKKNQHTLPVARAHEPFPLGRCIRRGMRFHIIFGHFERLILIFNFVLFCFWKSTIVWFLAKSSVERFFTGAHYPEPPSVRTLESTLSNEELFLEQAFPRKSIVSEDVNVNEHDWAAHWLVDSLLRIRAWKILRTDWLIGYYALVRDKFCPKTVSINNFSSERVDSEGLYGRRRLRLMGSCFSVILAWTSD